MLYIPLIYESLEYIPWFTRLYIPLVYKALYVTGLQRSYSIFPLHDLQGSIVYSPGLKGSIFYWFTKLLQYIYSPGLQGSIFPWHRRVPTLQYENFNSFQGISLWSALQVQQKHASGVIYMHHH
jgi:hypothetical protein